MGYAVLRVDFRGHGKSVFDKKFNQKSWTTFRNDTFEKYPQDVFDVITKIQNNDKENEIAKLNIFTPELSNNNNYKIYDWVDADHITKIEYSSEKFIK